MRRQDQFEKNGSEGEQGERSAQRRAQRTVSTKGESSEQYTQKVSKNIERCIQNRQTQGGEKASDTVAQKSSGAILIFQIGVHFAYMK